MKITKAASLIVALAVAASAFAALPMTSFADAPLYSYDFTQKETVYSNDFTATESYNFDDNQTPAGWDLYNGANVANGKLNIAVGGWGQNRPGGQFKPTLTLGRKYMISWDTSGLSTSGTAYEYLVDVISGSTTKDYPICYQPNGTLRNGKATITPVTSSTDKIIFDTTNGAFNPFFGGTNLTKDGDNFGGLTTDLTLNFWSLGADGYAIDNVTVTDITGWDIATGAKLESGAIRVDGSRNKTRFTPTLEAGETYIITWDVSGLGGNDYDYLVDLVSSTATAQYPICYNGKDNKWSNNNSWVSSDTSTTSKVIFNTGTGAWTTYSSDPAKNWTKTGTIGTTGLALDFYSWVDGFTIDNFKVEKVLTPDLSAWTFTANTGATQSIKAEDSTLKIPAYNSADLPLDLDQNSIYDIEWDWLGTTATANGYMSFGINSTDTIYHSIPGHLYYSGDHSDFYNKMHIRLSLNTQTGKWKVYVTDITNGTGTERDISIGGTATAPYKLQYNCWDNGGTHTIDNVTVTKTGVATDPVSADAAVYSVNVNGTYKIGTIITVNPSLYNNVVFEIGDTYYGGAISSVFDTTALGNINGEAVIGIIFEDAASKDVRVIFTNQSID